MREQCLPFTAAAALGFCIPAPFSWGYCNPDAVPKGARAFRSPVPGGCPDRVFYVIDDHERGFSGNQFLVPPDIRKRIGPGPIPGLSFFDREDQQDMVKLHLPYVWRTDPGVNLLFTEPINRPRRDGLRVMAGLVECDWYEDAVNLVLHLPAAPCVVHVRGGDILAQTVPISRMLRQPGFAVLEPHRRAARDAADGVARWRTRHDADRAAYKRLAKSPSGVLPDPDE